MIMTAHRLHQSPPVNYSLAGNVHCKGVAHLSQLAIAAILQQPTPSGGRKRRGNPTSQQQPASC